MTTTGSWAISEVPPPPVHPRLRAIFDKALADGMACVVYSATPPAMLGLPLTSGVETLVVGQVAYQSDGPRVVEGAWDEKSKLLRLKSGRELDLTGLPRPPK